MPISLNKSDKGNNQNLIKFYSQIDDDSYEEDINQ